MNSKIIFSLMILLIFSGCSKDITTESDFIKLKNALVNIPTNLDFIFTPDYTQTPLLCTPDAANIQLPANLWISENFEYLDSFDERNCFILNKGCEAVDDTHLNELFEGQITDINKNSIVFNGCILMNISNTSSYLKCWYKERLC